MHARHSVSSPGPGGSGTRPRAQLAAAVLALLALLTVAISPSTGRAQVQVVTATPVAAATPPPDIDLFAGRVIVRLRAGVPPIPLTVAQAAYSASAIEELTPLGVQRWSVPAGSERDIAARLSARPDVEYAEPDRVLHLTLVPNDTLYATHQWNLPKIGAPAAWDITTGAPAVVVAVVDSGFDTLHPDGPAHLRLGCDYVQWRATPTSTTCPRVSDDANGHGTHVAGIIGARQNNALGITGLAPDATVMVVRVADANGVAAMSDVARAIREAADAGARVVNMSLGGTTSTTTLERAVADAVGRDVVLVAAAGNDGQKGSPIAYPAAYPGVLAVGAVTVDDQHAAYSNVGDYVDLVAPVGNGGSLPNDSITSLYPVVRGAYASMVGTSQAAPQVAAAAALLLSVRPSSSAAVVSETLRTSARPIGGTRSDPAFGQGVLDVRAALSGAAAVQPTPPPTPAPVEATPAPSRSSPADPTPGPSNSTPDGSPAPTPTPQSSAGAQPAATFRQMIPLAPRRAALG